MNRFIIVLLLLPALSAFAAAPSKSNSSDVCKNAQSNLNARLCYEKLQGSATRQTDGLVRKIAAGLRKNESADSKHGTTSTNVEQRAAKEVIDSQATWKVYREQVCQALADSYGAGSGAGTAYEACRYRLAKQRLQDLHSAFVAGEWGWP
jgi:uncharacterized protein YecT (DUF1311 family)